MAALKFTVHYKGLDAMKSKLAHSATPAEHKVAETFARLTTPFVPMKTGVLNNTTQVHGNLIVYGGTGAPYARFLYGGVVYIDPKTGSTWAKKGERKVKTNRALKISQAVHPKAQSHWAEASMKQNMKRLEEAAAKAVLDELK